jgi:anti-sigma factor RsiW
MDQQKLRTLVFEKTGVRIDLDDPVFALVALNEAVLEETVERHVALLREANDTLAAQLAALQGGGPAQQTPVAPRPQAAPLAGPDRRTVALAAGAALLAAVLVLAGQAALRPAPPPALPAAARELTPEQSAAIRNGDKLARIVEKLDRKTRAAIAAEMQKP